MGGDGAAGHAERRAIRRGQTYSTVLTSVEDHRVVDVLPRREAGPLAAWLDRHPGVEIICRDRAGAYAEGARRGAPEALQDADRFHLWQGLDRVEETCVAAHRDCLRKAQRPLLSQDTRPASDRPQTDAEPVGRRAERKKAAHALVHEMLAQGHSRRRSPGNWAGVSTPCSDTRTPHAGGRPSARTGPGPASWTPTSPTWNGDSPRDAPASRDCTASWSPSRLPSPVAWSERTSPPCARLRPARLRGNTEMADGFVPLTQLMETIRMGRDTERPPF
ncbi:transposase [Streptomyces sp. NPDC059165]|uniref:transposase n=1 Tax=Streptomyces sp. NPDC059165 TaxID=3346751 RepID=UPI0036BD9684